MTAAVVSVPRDPGWVNVNEEAYIPRPEPRREPAPGDLLFPLESLGIRASRQYERIPDERTARRWLREVYDLVRPLFAQVGRGVDINGMAEKLAEKWGALVAFAREGMGSWEHIERRARQFLEYVSLPFPACGRGPKETEVERSLMRLADVRWWRRQIATALPRVVDNIARKFGQVHKAGQIYLSDIAFEMYQQRQRAARDLLEDLEAVNEVGQAYTLAELSDGSVSNPSIRRTELMVRLRGMEEYADEIGYSAVFVTLTAPSKYHCYSQGKHNDNWNFSSPRDVNDYLCRVWARVRANAQREGIEWFGLRVAEPHHDGTPHHHFVVFTGAHALQVEDIFSRYALAEDGKEPGARRHRLAVEVIDRDRGSAVGYVAKYISKAIDGHAIAHDRYGAIASDSAQRIIAWSRTWGIRQFQVFGTVPVGPWRELRRVRRQAPWPYEKARAATDNACFREYIKSALTLDLKTHKAEQLEFDELTGEILESPYNDYGEEKAPRVVGVIAHDIVECQPLVTRPMRWTVRRASASEPWTCVNNYTGLPDESAVPVFAMSFSDYGEPPEYERNFYGGIPT